MSKETISGEFDPLKNIYTYNDFKNGFQGWSLFGTNGIPSIENGVLIIPNKNSNLDFSNYSKRLTIMWRYFRWESYINFSNDSGYENLKYITWALDTQKGNAFPKDGSEDRRFYNIFCYPNENKWIIWAAPGISFTGTLHSNKWNYVSIDLDFINSEFLKMQFNDQIVDLRGHSPLKVVKNNERTRLTNLLHVGFGIASYTKYTTSILKVKSTCISGEGEYKYP